MIYEPTRTVFPQVEFRAISRLLLQQPREILPEFLDLGYSHRSDVGLVGIISKESEVISFRAVKFRERSHLRHDRLAELVLGSQRRNILAGLALLVVVLIENGGSV